MMLRQNPLRLRFGLLRRGRILSSTKRTTVGGQQQIDPMIQATATAAPQDLQQPGIPAESRFSTTARSSSSSSSSSASSPSSAQSTNPTHDNHDHHDLELELELRTLPLWTQTYPHHRARDPQQQQQQQLHEPRPRTRTRFQVSDPNHPDDPTSVQVVPLPAFLRRRLRGGTVAGGGMGIGIGIGRGGSVNHHLHLHLRRHHHHGGSGSRQAPMRGFSSSRAGGDPVDASNNNNSCSNNHSNNTMNTANEMDGGTSLRHNHGNDPHRHGGSSAQHPGSSGKKQGFPPPFISWFTAPTTSTPTTATTAATATTKGAASKTFPPPFISWFTPPPPSQTAGFSSLRGFRGLSSHSSHGSRISNSRSSHTNHTSRTSHTSHTISRRGKSSSTSSAAASGTAPERPPPPPSSDQIEEGILTAVLGDASQAGLDPRPPKTGITSSSVPSTAEEDHVSDDDGGGRIGQASRQTNVGSDNPHHYARPEPRDLLGNATHCNQVPDTGFNVRFASGEDTAYHGGPADGTRHAVTGRAHLDPRGEHPATASNDPNSAIGGSEETNRGRYYNRNFAGGDSLEYTRPGTEAARLMREIGDPEHPSPEWSRVATVSSSSSDPSSSSSSSSPSSSSTPRSSSSSPPISHSHHAAASSPSLEADQAYTATSTTSETTPSSPHRLSMANTAVPYTSEPSASSSATSSTTFSSSPLTSSSSSSASSKRPSPSSKIEHVASAYSGYESLRILDMHWGEDEAGDGDEEDGEDGEERVWLGSTTTTTTAMFAAGPPGSSSGGSSGDSHHRLHSRQHSTQQQQQQQQREHDIQEQQSMLNSSFETAPSDESPTRPFKGAGGSAMASRPTHKLGDEGQPFDTRDEQLAEHSPHTLSVKEKKQLHYLGQAQAKGKAKKGKEKKEEYPEHQPSAAQVFLNSISNWTVGELLQSKRLARLGISAGSSRSTPGDEESRAQSGSASSSSSKSGGVSSDVLQVEKGQPASAAIRKMLEHGVGSVLVTDGKTGETAGLVTKGDLIGRAALMSGQDPDKVPVEELMTPAEELRTVSPGDTLRHCLRVLTRHRFGHLPVREHGSKRVVAMLSVGDIVGTLLKEAVETTDELQRFIRGAYPA